MSTAEFVPRKVLLVEDHTLIARLTAQLIEEIGHAVIGPAGSIAEAARLAAAQRPHVALVDLTLPDGNGAELIGDLRAQGIACAILSGQDPALGRTRETRDVPWLLKPPTQDQLVDVIAKLTAAEPPPVAPE